LSLSCSIQHRLCGGNFIVGASGRCLDIDDHGILDIDEVVQPISELHALLLALAVHADWGSDGEITLGGWRS
jgi:hypothetical protein